MNLYGKKLNVDLCDSNGNVIIPKFRKITMTLLRRVHKEGTVITDDMVQDFHAERAVARIQKKNDKLARLYAKEREIKLKIKELEESE